MSSPAPGFRLVHAALLSLLAFGAALVGTLGWTEGAVRMGLLWGLGATFVGSAIGFVLLGFVLAQAEVKVLDLMRAQVLGFLARLLLVAIGLVVVRRGGGDAIAFAVGFFALFFGVGVLEAVVVFKHPVAAQGGPVPGADGSKTDV